MEHTRQAVYIRIILKKKTDIHSNILSDKILSTGNVLQNAHCVWYHCQTFFFFFLRRAAGFKYNDNLENITTLEQRNN